MQGRIDHNHETSGAPDEGVKRYGRAGRRFAELTAAAAAGKIEDAPSFVPASDAATVNALPNSPAEINSSAASGPAASDASARLNSSSPSGPGAPASASAELNSSRFSGPIAAANAPTPPSLSTADGPGAAPPGLSILIGGLVTVLLMLVALWSWRHGAELIQLAGVEKPDLAEWSVRCGAVAVAAIAQAVLLTFVIGAVFRRDAVTDTLRLLAVILFLLAISAALALGIAGR